MATTHLACALSLSRCLTPSDYAHMARTCLFVNLCLPCITGFTSLSRYCSEPRHASRFCLILMPLGANVPLVSDRMTPCPINPSLSVLGSDSASLCFPLPPGGEGERRDRLPKKKKKEMRMLVHCPIYFAFSITML